MSIQLLSAGGFAETRVITPNSTQRFAQSSISPTSVPLQKPKALKQKSSFAQLGDRLFSLGSLFTQPALIDDATARFTPANDCHSLSSAASSEHLDESEDTPEEATYRINPVVFEAQSVEAQQRALDWVATTNHALSGFANLPTPTATIKRAVSSPTAVVVAAEPSVSSATARLIPLSPATPLPITKETFHEASMEAVDASGTARGTLHRTLKHAKSTPALRQPAVCATRQYVRRSLHPAQMQQLQARQPKLLRKAASCAVLRPAPLTPLLTLDRNTPLKRSTSAAHSKVDESTRVVKMPSPERAEMTAPRGRRQDVRSLWHRTTDENQQPERDGEFTIIRAFDEPSIRTFESTYDANSATSLGSAAGSLKAVLGRTKNQQCLPFKVGLMPPRGGWQQEAPQILIEDCSEG